MFSTGHYRDLLDYLSTPIDPIFDYYQSASFRPNLFSPRRRTDSKFGGTNKDHVTPDKVFKVMFEVKQFSPDDVTVKVVEEGTVVEVHAKHVEKPDEHGFISREFTRRHKLPSDVNPEELRATMSYDGILVISVPFKDQGPPTREVPMQFKDWVDL